MQELRPLLLAYHDRSDGGLFATLCEMAFAGHCGVTLSLDALAFDAAADDVDAFKRDAEEQLAGRVKDLALAALFSEELGAVLQIRAADRAKVMGALRAAGLGEHAHVIGQLNARDEIRITRNNRSRCSPPSATTCSASGARPAGACRRCATTRSARARSTTASSSRKIRAFRCT